MKKLSVIIVVSITILLVLFLFFIPKDTPVFSAEKQRNPQESDAAGVLNMGRIAVDSPYIIDMVISSMGGDSVRVYSGYPDFDDLTSGVILSGYLPSSQISDNMERKPDVKDETAGDGKPGAENLPEQMYNAASENKMITAVVFDRAQIPVSFIVFTIDRD